MLTKTGKGVTECTFGSKLPNAHLAPQVTECTFGPLGTAETTHTKTVEPADASASGRLCCGSRVRARCREVVVFWQERSLSVQHDDLGLTAGRAVTGSERGPVHSDGRPGHEFEKCGATIPTWTPCAAGEVEKCTRNSSERARRSVVHGIALCIAFCGKLRCAS